VQFGPHKPAQSTNKSRLSTSQQIHDAVSPLSTVGIFLSLLTVVFNLQPIAWKEQQLAAPDGFPLQGRQWSAKMDFGGFPRVEGGHVVVVQPDLVRLV
jgi:hypothetical protein